MTPQDKIYEEKIEAAQIIAISNAKNMDDLFMAGAKFVIENPPPSVMALIEALEDCVHTLENTKCDELNWSKGSVALGKEALKAYEKGEP